MTMNKFLKINIIYLKFRNKIFVNYLKFKKRIFSPSAPQKILFSDSKPDWSMEIKKGFKNSKHTIYFDVIHSDNIKAYDLVVPLTIQELENKEIQKLLANNPIPIPSIESVLLCDDKYQFNKALISNGFGGFIPRMNDSFAFPFILKKKIDQYGENTHIISGVQEEAFYSDKIASEEYFTQEIITGKKEYATHIVFKNGQILNSLNIKYIFKKDISIKGKDESLTLICPCPYLDIFASILAFIGFEGLCCFNYKVRNNTPFIIEINPRFGGSLTPYFSLFV